MIAMVEDTIDWKDILAKVKATNEFIECPNCRRMIPADDRLGIRRLETTLFHCYTCGLTWMLRVKNVKDWKKVPQTPITPEILAHLIMEQGVNVEKIVTVLGEAKYLDRHDLEALRSCIERAIGAS